jgi:Uma2 family endonuclease
MWLLQLLTISIRTALPLGWPHGEHHAHLIHLLLSYSLRTPGTGVADNVTVILGEEDEVQPDVVLRVVQEKRGRSQLTREKFVQGPPELVAEIAGSSRAIDLHLKKNRYAQAGITEYVVVCLEPRQLYWFDLQKQSRLPPSADGIIKSNIFPGLWIHAQGLLRLDNRSTTKALERGLQSPQHHDFVSEIAGESR